MPVTCTVLLGVEDELLGGAQGIKVDASDVLVERGLHNAEELLDLLLVSCHCFPFPSM
jgi:hypothetical protein